MAVLNPWSLDNPAPLGIPLKQIGDAIGNQQVMTPVPALGFKGFTIYDAINNAKKALTSPIKPMATKDVMNMVAAGSLGDLEPVENAASTAVKAGAKQLSGVGEGMLKKNISRVFDNTDEITGRELFHATPEKNLRGILENGLQMGKEPRFGESQRGGLYFSPSIRKANEFVEASEKPVFLRVKGGDPTLTEKLKGKLGWDKFDMSGQSISTNVNIPPEYLEVKTKDGWKSLENFRPQPSPLTGLAEEARKYKSADEFANKNVGYITDNKQLNMFDQVSKKHFANNNIQEAENVGLAKDSWLRAKYQTLLNKNRRWELADYGETCVGQDLKGKLNKSIDLDKVNPELAASLERKILRMTGEKNVSFDSVYLNDEGIIVSESGIERLYRINNAKDFVKPINVLDKSQLQDFYNKAVKK